MKKQRFFYLLLIGICLLPFLSKGQNANNPKSFSLAEAQAFALEHNDSIKLALADIRIAKQQIKETTAIGLPQVSASLEGQYFFDIPTQLLPDFISPAVYGVLIDEGILAPQNIPSAGMTAAQFGTNYNISAGISANQLLFDGQYIVGLKAAKAVKELSNSMLNTSKTQVKTNVSKLYLQSLALAKTLEILKLNTQAIDENIIELNELLKEGFIEELDVDRLKLAKQRMENQITKSEQAAQLIILLLKIQMGYPIEDEIILTENFEDYLIVSENLLQQEANPSKRVEYQTLLVNKELQILNAQRYRAGYLPSLSAFFSYSENALVNDFNAVNKGQNWFPTTVGGITLSLPIFDGLSKSAKISQAKIDEEKAEIQIHQFSEGVKLQVEQAKNAYSSAITQYEIEKLNYELSEKIYNRAQFKYKEGVGSSLEVSTALTDFYTAQTNFVNSQYQLINSKINLEKALGLLNQQ